MSAANMKNAISTKRLLSVVAATAALLLTAAAQAAAPGIAGPTFNLTAQPAFISQPDGQAVYSWGYGCTAAPPSFRAFPAGTRLRSATPASAGPTLVVTEGDTVSVTLTNNLPTAAGNTSILFSRF